MLICMRTTLNLPDALAEAVKARAAAQGRTFTSLVEEGLRAVLMTPEATDRPAAKLPVSGRPGGRILVDLHDRDAVWDALDADWSR